MRQTLVSTLLASVVLAGVSVFSSMPKTVEGAAVGTVVGGAAGAVIGNQTGSTARGAIIGAVIGGAAGTIIGHQMDQHAKEIEQNVPGAIVERVGDGSHVTFPSRLLFDFYSYAVRSDAATNLNSLATSLTKYDDSNLMIVGHTDGVGSSDYNQRLSERRAESAARYLTADGVARHIATAGLGGREPIASNTTEDGRQRNRRIEIAIYASPALQEDARRQSAGR